MNTSTQTSADASPFNISRRVLGGVAAKLCLVYCMPALAKPTDAQIARNGFVQAIPVLPWLTLGETTKQQVLPQVQRLKTQYQGALLVSDGVSVETGGYFINLATAIPQGMLNEQGLQMLTLDFDARQVLQLVVFQINRGWKDKNLPPFVERMKRRYSNLANPDYLGDPLSEATDKVIIFDIGKFVIELRLPQHGTYATGTLTTKEILRKLRAIDGTIHIYSDLLN